MFHSSHFKFTLFWITVLYQALFFSFVLDVTSEQEMFFGKFSSNNYSNSHHHSNNDNLNIMFLQECVFSLQEGKVIHRPTPAAVAAASGTVGLLELTWT